MKLIIVALALFVAGAACAQAPYKAVNDASGAVKLYGSGTVNSYRPHELFIAADGGQASFSIWKYDGSWKLIEPYITAPFAACDSVFTIEDGEQALFNYGSVDTPAIVYVTAGSATVRVWWR